MGIDTGVRGKGVGTEEDSEFVGTLNISPSEKMEKNGCGIWDSLSIANSRNG